MVAARLGSCGMARSPNVGRASSLSALLSRRSFDSGSSPFWYLLCYVGDGEERVVSMNQRARERGKNTIAYTEGEAR